MACENCYYDYFNECPRAEEDRPQTNWEKACEDFYDVIAGTGYDAHVDGASATEIEEMWQIIRKERNLNNPTEYGG